MERDYVTRISAMGLCSPPAHGLVAILLFVLIASSCSGNTPWTPKEADKTAFDPNVDWGPLAVRKTFEQSGNAAEGDLVVLAGSYDDQPFTYSEIDWANPHQCSQELEYWALDTLDRI